MYTGFKESDGDANAKDTNLSPARFQKPQSWREVTLSKARNWGVKNVIQITPNEHVYQMMWFLNLLRLSSLSATQAKL